jgi:catechol 2,3-dioxygenase-like lactoylglutathione lyase family enzyme
MEFSAAAAGFGKIGRPSFFIEMYGEPVQGRLHIAFRAESRAHVDAFHAEALAAGGTDNGAPGIRYYHPDYYGAYVLDPDSYCLTLMQPATPECGLMQIAANGCRSISGVQLRGTARATLPTPAEITPRQLGRLPASASEPTVGSWARRFAA